MKPWLRLSLGRCLLIGAASVTLLSACKPAGPPPDLLAPQRAALNKAKAVEGQLQDDLQQRMKAVDKDQ